MLRMSQRMSGLSKKCRKHSREKYDILKETFVNLRRANNFQYRNRKRNLEKVPKRKKSWRHQTEKKENESKINHQQTVLDWFKAESTDPLCKIDLRASRNIMYFSTELDKGED